MEKANQNNGTEKAKNFSRQNETRIQVSDNDARKQSLYIAAIAQYLDGVLHFMG